MTESVVHMLRHGEVHNPKGVLYGQLPDFHLSELGAAMAKAAAAAVAARKIVYVVASPLERAQETAEPVAEQFGLTVETDPRLIESANWFEGRKVGVGDGALRDPRNWWVLRNPFAPSWGEPYSMVAARMAAALHEARQAAEAAGGEAFCVSHQLPIWILRRSFEGKRLWHDPRNRRCNLASLTSFQFRNGKLNGIEYSEPAGHLIAQSATARRAKGA
ncbi:MAG: histidine phosphatase family protein [Micromonosporaceae bacterium]